MTMQGTFRVLSIVIFLILTALAIYLSEEILVQYAAKDTSFSQSVTKVTEEDSPTIVFGFWPLKVMNYPGNVPYMAYEQLELGKHFNVNFGIVEDFYHDIERISLDFKNNSLRLSHDDIGKVKFTKLLTKFGNYYKISANLLSVKDPYMASLKIYFDNDIPDDEIPNIDVRFSTESASYGVTMWYWLDGDPISVAPAIGFQTVLIRPQKKINLDNCNEDQTFYECFDKALEAHDYSHCPRKCSAVSTISNTIPVCETTEEFICAYEIAKKIKNSDSCLHQCSQTNYKLYKSIYTENMTSENAKRNVQIIYRIPLKDMTIQKEYLIHDFIGMLGSIGGTLGMFIGFSFIGVISSLMKYLQKFIHYLSFKKNKTNVIQIKEASKDNEQIMEELINQMTNEFKRRVLEESRSLKM